jgi:hypothetical protein
VELAGRSRSGCQTCNYPTKQAERETFNVFKLKERLWVSSQKRPGDEEEFHQLSCSYL